MIMEITEKTRVNFSGEKALSIIAFLLLTAWGIHTYVSKQMERDDSQDNNIEIVKVEVKQLKAEFKESSLEINKKLDLIISHQNSDHDKVNEMVIRHEYLNFNKNIK